MENLDLEMLTLKLLSIDTQNGDDVGDKKTRFLGETKAAVALCADALMQTPGVTVEIQDYDVQSKDGKEVLRTNRANLIARLSRTMHGLPTVMLQGHLDTVPFKDEQDQIQSDWTFNPLGEVRDGVIYGRGTGDMKGPVAAMVATFAELATRSDLKYNPVLLLTSDEEANGFAGIKRFLSENKNKIDFAICGDGEDFRIADRFKGAMGYNIIFKGKGGHGSRPWEGANAVHAAIPTLQRLYELVDHIPKDRNPALESDDAHTAHATMNIGKVSGGTKINSIADECRIEFEMRPVRAVEYYIQLIEEKIISVLPPEAKCFPSGPRAGPTFIPDNNYIHRLEECVRDVRSLPAKRGVTHGFTEAYELYHAGKIPTVVFGPTSPGHHGPNEQVLLKDLETLRDIYVAFFTKQ